MYCFKCGVVIPESSVFCMKCGSELPGTENVLPGGSVSETARAAGAEPPVTSPPTDSVKAFIERNSDAITKAAAELALFKQSRAYASIMIVLAVIGLGASFFSSESIESIGTALISTVVVAALAGWIFFAPLQTGSMFAVLIHAIDICLLLVLLASGFLGLKSSSPLSSASFHLIPAAFFGILISLRLMMMGVSLFRRRRRFGHVRADRQMIEWLHVRLAELWAPTNTTGSEDLLSFKIEDLTLSTVRLRARLFDDHILVSSRRGHNCWFGVTSDSVRCHAARRQPVDLGGVSELRVAGQSCSGSERSKKTDRER